MQDVIAQGLAKGWAVHAAHTLADGSILEADVVVIGTGAGGATAAEFLSSAGHNVLLLEEGKLRYQKDFKMDELEAFSGLYQEGTGRKTSNGAIAIYQGRSVGGSTTVNWTSSFRTPTQTLNHWKTEHGLLGLSSEDLSPWFKNREQALNMSQWLVPPNANNDVLRRGCEALGYRSGVMTRNVNGCWNLGYCGYGCPTNAKQSMLVTSIPKALDLGAQLVSGARAERFIFENERAVALQCSVLDSDANLNTGRKLQLRAKHFVLAAGAIGSPGLLLRSEAPDPYSVLGKRTFLHPVNSSTATMPESVHGYEGAPQSVYSDQFLWRDGVAGKAGFKLEVAPVHPGSLAAQEASYGQSLANRMRALPYTNSMIALIRDGFHEESQGGQVRLRDDGSPLLDYEITDYLWEGLREAYRAMAEIQFAAGAKEVSLVHHDAAPVKSWKAAQEQIQELPMKALHAGLFSAHVMGGCGMGEDPKTSVVSSAGQHHQIENLSVMDGSTFPTSIGANPQLSIYGLVAKQASALGARL